MNVTDYGPSLIQAYRQIIRIQANKTNNKK